MKNIAYYKYGIPFDENGNIVSPLIDVEHVAKNIMEQNEDKEEWKFEGLPSSDYLKTGLIDLQMLRDSLNRNYREILKKYIQYIKSIEGADYITDYKEPHSFTPDEWQELERLSKEAK